VKTIFWQQNRPVAKTYSVAIQLMHLLVFPAFSSDPMEAAENRNRVAGSFHEMTNEISKLRVRLNRDKRIK